MNTNEDVRAGLHLLEPQEPQEPQDAAKLDMLRRDAGAGADAYRRGDYTVIVDERALDGFVEDIATEADKA
jgi:hypothetical protein